MQSVTVGSGAAAHCQRADWAQGQPQCVRVAWSFAVERTGSCCVGLFLESLHADRFLPHFAACCRTRSAVLGRRLSQTAATLQFWASTECSHAAAAGWMYDDDLCGLCIRLVSCFLVAVLVACQSFSLTCLPSAPFPLLMMHLLLRLLLLLLAQHPRVLLKPTSELPLFPLWLRHLQLLLLVRQLQPQQLRCFLFQLLPANLSQKS